MTGQDFLSLSKELLKTDTEAARRTSVSRAYYALFHHVKSYLTSFGVPVEPSYGAHQQIIRYLKNSGIDDVKHVGSKLDDMRTFRNDADYHLRKKRFEKLTCSLNYKMAETLFDQLDNVDKANFKAGITSYGKRVNEM